jgi:feruloyl esterase
MAQTFGELARSQGRIDRNGLPFINRSFTDADLAVVTAGIVNACDALDGAEDGMSQNFRACEAAFDPADLKCSDSKRSTCLSAAQVRTLRRQIEGPRLTDGTQLNIRWPWDIGIVQGQLRGAWIGPFDALQASSVLVSNSWATGHLTPPPTFDLTARNGSDILKFLLDFDFDADWQEMFATTETYSESPWELTYATGIDLATFRERGGKLVIWHGMSDGPFNPNETAKWWHALNAEYRGRASEFVRIFFVPGMGHCGGGPATSQFDLFTALVDWVEKDAPPNRVSAIAPNDTPWPGRTRPLCPYPEYARYLGSGSIEMEENFSCVAMNEPTRPK